MRKSLSFFPACLLLLMCMIVCTTCYKEYSYENNAAVYTLDGAGGACAGDTVAGSYYTGIALGPGNIVQLVVNVTTAGRYALQTNSGDGIQFSASGNFSNTGIQKITLMGSGSPDSAGNFSFNPQVDSSCSFIIPVTVKPVLIASFTLAGSPNECTSAMVNGSYSPGVQLTNTNTVTITANVTSIGNYTINTDTLDGISFSASGTFTNTGIQTVALAGSGTPETARNLVFTPQVPGSSCTFNLTVVPTGQLATYVLVSGQNLCIGSVAGTFAAGTPLSASNTYSLQVYVTVIGNFAIATNSLDGVIFTYAGTFSATGTQTVTLTGSGTPSSAGTFTFTPQIVGPAPLGGQVCDFSVTVSN